MPSRIKALRNPPNLFSHALKSLNSVASSFALFGDNIAHDKAKSVHVLGLMNSATKEAVGRSSVQGSWGEGFRLFLGLIGFRVTLGLRL